MVVPNSLAAFLRGVSDGTFWIGGAHGPPAFNSILAEWCQFAGHRVITMAQLADGTLPNLSTFQRAVAKEAQRRRSDSMKQRVSSVREIQ